MNQYDAVCMRKSVRRFKMELLPQAFFKNLRKFEQGLQPLEPELSYSIEIVDAMGSGAKFKGMFRVKAPYYLVFYSVPGAGAMTNAGYLMEQLVLYMTAREVGTCYQGALSVKGIEEPEGMEPLMVLAFGTADEPVYREMIRAKRLPFKELCVFREDSTEETRLMLQAARLAPSAMNGQPWRFVVYQNRIHVFIRKELFAFPTKKRLVLFDMGIMLWHISLAAEETWREISFTRREEMAAKELKNNEYFLTVLLV
ncbi:MULTISPECIES: nitroreductase family protein [unclassified Candidatus Paralachnospira]|uniref:nitroreductase family protein n=1 Tax=unclassified Candidatus Paralachnospira TaxID=3099471 RepID=UPI003032923A